MQYSLRAYPVAEQRLPTWACLFGKNQTSWERLVFYVWVVQGGGITVVIDAGTPPSEHDFRVLSDACAQMAPECAMQRTQSLASVFNDAGIAADAVDILIITQPITYHTGGLLPDFFPRATVYLPRAGLLEFLLDNPGHPPRDCYFTEDTWLFLHRLTREGRLILPDGRVEVLQDLWFEVTGGHHPGSAAVTIATARGSVALLETAFLADNIEWERPVGIAENASLCRAVIKKFKNSCDLVLAIHDSTIQDRFPGGLIA